MKFESGELPHNGGRLLVLSFLAVMSQFIPVIWLFDGGGYSPPVSQAPPPPSAPADLNRQEGPPIPPPADAE